MDYQVRLMNKQYKLSDTENELADYIKRNPNDVIYMTITELSSKIYTVPNTVIRLCRKLGYSGYSELKIDLKQELLRKNDQLDERMVMNNTFDLIDKKREQFVVNKINDADKVLTFAVGETSYPVQDFSSTMNALNHKTVFYTYENQIISDIKNSSKTLIILVSISGQNDQIIRIAKIAKESGQFVISLTHIAENPLEMLSDLSLFCFSPSRRVKDVNITDKTPVYLV